MSKFIDYDPVVMEYGALLRDIVIGGSGEELKEFLDGAVGEIGIERTLEIVRDDIDFLRLMLVSAIRSGHDKSETLTDMLADIRKLQSAIDTNLAARKDVPGKSR